MNTSSNPVVSVIVITYNSGKFILETLESIRNQTYGNIELIVSDDCSKDNTAELCRDWMAQHGPRFSGARFVVTGKNKGIAGNCNTGMHAANGEMVKLIAGDDILEPECISEFVAYLRDNPKADFVCCAMTPFGEVSRYEPYFPPESYFRKSARGQLRMLLKRGTMVPGPAMFFRKAVCTDVGGFDESFPFIEDYPYFIKLARAGYRCFLLRKPLVRYRVHEQSITQKGSSLFDESIRKCQQELVFPLLRKEGLFLFVWHYWLETQVNERRGGNSPFSSLTVRRIVKLADPVGLLMAIYKLFGRSYPYRAEFTKIDSPQAAGNA